MKRIDESQISIGTFEDGEHEPEINGYSIPMLISEDEAASLIADYDPDNAYSPDASTSREIARLILDALKKAMEG
tara:strand:+ start:131 stop:355 length:225 start_codon:yes stop_codon:yes gene_type:complete